MAERNLAIAAFKSSRSTLMPLIRSSTSCISASARKLTGPIFSRSRIRRSYRPSSTVMVSSSHSIVSSGFNSAKSRRASGLAFSRSRMRAVMLSCSWRARSRCDSHRIKPSRCWLKDWSASRCALSAKLSLVSAAVRASVASRHSASAFSIASPRPWRFSAITTGCPARRSAS